MFGYTIIREDLLEKIRKQLIDCKRIINKTYKEKFARLEAENESLREELAKLKKDNDNNS